MTINTTQIEKYKYETGPVENSIGIDGKVSFNQYHKYTGDPLYITQLYELLGHKFRSNGLIINLDGTITLNILQN